LKSFEFTSKLICFLSQDIINIFIPPVKCCGFFFACKKTEKTGTGKNSKFLKCLTEGKSYTSEIHKKVDGACECANVADTNPNPARCVQTCKFLVDMSSMWENCQAKTSPLERDGYPPEGGVCLLRLPSRIFAVKLTVTFLVPAQEVYSKGRGQARISL
jgi:hypothetical protein